MGISKEDNRIKLEGFISDRDLSELQMAILELDSEEKIIDLSECEDLHTAIIQLLCAFKISKKCQFIFSGDSAFKKALEGCSSSEEYSS